ncbi:MAG: DUF3570 domain-containing protein [Gammaproteobacteria bacterium]|nr:DUF3570 domain-containing protein [Gammaproteobacteria bacterium]
MQLARKKIAGLLSIATCSLLGNASRADTGDWDVDSAILFYDEPDRVSAVEPVISATKDLGDDETLSMKIVLDILTGASANGAVPSASVQTFTTPSGGRGDDDDGDEDDSRGLYTVQPNETPLDDTFEDERIAFSLNWDKPVNRNNRRNLGLNLSAENDFLSVSTNARWQHDLNQRNTTLTFGINLELDVIDPLGRTPVPFSSMVDLRRQSGTESREVVDLIFGVTQVINRSSLFQVNLSLSNSDGYMTDPYKFVSVVDGTGEPIDQLFENRPDGRSRQSIFGKYKKTLANKDIFTASYRYMTDDWEIDSHTFDFTYRYKINQGYFFEPHLRFYQQTAAEFYRYFLSDSEALPEFVSADYRLGDLDTTTVGIKFGKDTDGNHHWSARYEYYLQTGESSPSEAIGQLRQQDLFPDVEAYIVQFSYSFTW